jgi:hypothetical protein
MKGEGIFNACGEKSCWAVKLGAGSGGLILPGWYPIPPPRHEFLTAHKFIRFTPERRTKRIGALHHPHGYLARKSCIE